MQALLRAWPGVVLALLLSAGLLIWLPLEASASYTQQDQPASPPDLETYERWLREAYSAAQRRDRLGLEMAVERLLDVEQVRLPDDTLAPADNRWLAEALDQSDDPHEEIAARLGALIDALAQPDMALDPQALQKLQGILSRPPFATPESDDLNWLEQFFQALSDFLEWLLPSNGAIARGSSAAFGWTLLILGGFAVVALLIYAAYSLRRGMVGEAQASSSDPEAGLTSSAALQQAGEIARGGNYRIAMRYLYLSSLLWLDERELLRYDRALTNREYLAQVRDNHALHTRLVPVVETFDQVWYGHTTIDQAAFEAYQRQIEELRRSIGTR